MAEIANSDSQTPNLHEKFKYGLPDDYSNEDLDLFVQYRLTIYTAKGWTHSRLSNYHAEDFNHFSAETFSQLTRDTRRSLRDYLLDHGVYVPHGRSTKIFNAIRAAVDDELEWPDTSNKKKGNTVNKILGGKQIDNHGERSPIVENETTETNNSTVTQRTNEKDNENSINTQRNIFTASRSTVRPAEKEMDSNQIWKGTTNVLKIYASAPSTEKYSGNLTDILELKLAIYSERCEQNGIPFAHCGPCFSAMLCGAALNYYFTTIKHSTKDYSEMTDMIRKRYMTSERELSLTREWNSIRLKDFINRYPEKTAVESFELMVARLNALRLTLSRPFQDNAMLRNRLLDACDDIPECRLARQKVSDTVQGAIADLQTCISTYQPQQPTAAQDQDTYIVDRRRYPPTQNRQYQRSNASKNRRCFVCQKEGCWSTNHTPDERVRALGRNKKTRAYIMESLLFDEDDRSPIGQDTQNELDEVTVHLTDFTKYTGALPEQDNLSHPDDYSHEGKNRSCSMNTRVFLTDLCNSATAYRVTRRLPRFRYQTTKFFGVAIDTCCSRASTGGLNQYKAYCAHVGINPQLEKRPTPCIYFGKSKGKTIGTASCAFPVGSFYLSFDFIVVDDDVPILLSLADMDRLRVKYDNLQDLLTHADTKQTAIVSRDRGHSFIIWNPFQTCLFTEPASEIRPSDDRKTLQSLAPRPPRIVKIVNAQSTEEDISPLQDLPI